MRKLIILISLTVLLCGCNGNYIWDPDPIAWQRAWTEFGRQQTEIWKSQQPTFPIRQSHYNPYNTRSLIESEQEKYYRRLNADFWRP